MKKLEFESNGSKWLLADLNSDQGLYDLQDELGYCLEKSEKYFYVKDITEEQASEVVGDYSKRAIQEHDGSIGNYYINHLYNPIQASHIWCKSAIDSLHSLLKSKGVYLYENPAPLLSSSRLEAESNTFYNPVLFKIL